MDCYEAVSGRAFTAYYRPGGVYRDLPDRMPVPAVADPQRSGDRADEREPAGQPARFQRRFTRRFPKYVDEYETLLTGTGPGSSARWHRRRHPGAGKALGFTGPSAQLGRCLGSAQKWLYAVYTDEVDIPVGTTGDCYDRYLVRVRDARSNRIIKQCIDWLRDNLAR
jgi:NADH-quinone oxidoreductase subunit D